MPTNPTTTDPRTSYTSTSIDVRNIANLIDIVSPDDTPFLKLVGMDSAQKLLRSEIFNRKVEWIEDELSPTSGTSNEAMDATETGLDVSAGQGTRFIEGDIVIIKATTSSESDELVWVVSAAANSLTVVRAFDGDLVNGSTHATGATLEIVGNARIEGDTPPDPRTVLTSQPYNYTQIFEEAIHITGTQLATKEYGMDDEWDYQVGKKFRELLIKLERSVIDGVRQAGSATTARSMGGLRHYVTNGPAALAGAALKSSDLEGAIQARFEAVGGAYMPTLIVCNGWGKRKISGFYTPYVRTERLDKAGGVVIDRVTTDFGELTVMLNRWCPTDRLYLLNPDFVGVGAMRTREFYEERLAKTADAVDGHILGEYTAIVKNPAAHAVIKGFSTTS